MLSLIYYLQKYAKLKRHKVEKKIDFPFQTFCSRTKKKIKHSMPHLRWYCLFCTGKKNRHSILPSHVEHISGKSIADMKELNSI